MASIHSKGKSLKESVENIKVKVLDLLEVCGIKDADIPLFNDPYMRNKQQSLITSFGTMFKSSSHMTPQRIRSNHARHNPTLYADMLIEELLAQAGSNDSDASSAQAMDSTPELPTSESSDSLDVQFASLFDIMESDIPTTSSNSFSTSDGYPKTSETSSNGSLPSREDELRERDAYYSDITIDRENNAEIIKSSVNKKLYTLVTSDDSQLLVRTVEGAESSPENFMFQTPPSRLIAPRAVSCKYRASPLKSSGLRRQQQFYSNNNIPSSHSSSLEQTPTRSLHYYNQNSVTGSRSLHYNHKSATSSRSCTTHPIASSTFIMDSDSPSTEAGSVYTWSIDEESSPCNLEKSYIRSTSGKKKRTRRQLELSSRASNIHPAECIPGSQSNLSSNPDASHSIAPSDTDSTSEINSESSVLNDRPYITGKSSTSDSSSCTAARCRPRIRKNPHRTTEDSVQPHPNQELLDSILTDSPRSVDSSGIFVPHNSYNSPVQSVGSHNGYSSSVSSCLSSDSHRAKKSSKVPPLTVSHKANTSTYIAAPHPLRETTEENVFKRPFNPAPHVDHTVRAGSRNQGVITEIPQGSSSVGVNTETPQRPSSVGVMSETPQRPSSIRSAPVARQSLFVVPPGVVTGPPKIKDKKSLVKKLKQFSSHFYRKTEKIKTLANL